MDNFKEWVYLPMPELLTRVLCRKDIAGIGNAWWTTSKEWTSLSMPDLLTRILFRKDWKRISAESSLMSPR